MASPSSSVSVGSRIVPLLPLIVLLLIPVFLPERAGAETGAAERWLEQMERFFDANPEYKELPGHGWKPFNRARWLYEARKPRLKPESVGSRWDAWKEMTRRFPERSKTASAAPWFQLGPSNMSGRMLDIEFDPTDVSTVYAGSASGGLWKTTNGGGSWSVVTDTLPDLAIGAVAILPWDSNTILIGTGEATFANPGLFGVGILRSTDGGATWQTTSLTSPLDGSQGFHGIEVNPLTGTILAAANDGLYRSVDEGVHWTEVLDGNFYDVKWKPGDSTRVYTVGGAPGNRTVRVSDDDGSHWAVAGTGQPSAGLVGKTQLGVTPADPDVVYAHYSDGSGNTIGIYRTVDDGVTWNAMNTTTNVANGQGWYSLSLAVDPNNEDIIITGGVYLYRSINGGVSLSQVGGNNGLGSLTAVHVDHHAVEFEPGSSSLVWVATDGGIWKSFTFGASWLSRRQGLVTYQFYDICVAQSNPSFMMGGTQDNGIPGYTGTDTWVESDVFVDGMVCNIDPADDMTVYGESQYGGHLKSVNGGGSWTDIVSGIIGTGLWVTPVDMDRNDADRLVTSTDKGIFRTQDGGAFWEKISAKPRAAKWISVSPVDGDVIWVLAPDSASTFYSLNDGDNWNIAGAYPFTPGSPGKILAHPTDVATAFVTFASYGSPVKVAMTSNTGATWTDATGDLPDLPVNTIAVDPDYPECWYVGTDIGVWTSLDGGNTWAPYGSGMPNAVVFDLEIHESTRKLVAATYGRGAWEVDLPDPTHVAGRPSAPPPRDLMLDPPYPNPVSRSTLLRFAARAAGSVTLDVYDVRGRRVSRIGEFAQGDGIVRNMEWSADGLSSGVYFLVLRGGGEQLARRVVIAR